MREYKYVKQIRTSVDVHDATTELPVSASNGSNITVLNKLILM